MLLLQNDDNKRNWTPIDGPLPSVPAISLYRMYLLHMCIQLRAFPKIGYHCSSAIFGTESMQVFISPFALLLSWSIQSTYRSNIQEAKCSFSE